jgi:hypothetical protein
MPTAVEHSIIAILKPFQGDATDLSLDITGLHIPEAAQQRTEHTSDAASINFALTGDALHLDIGLLVPAVQHHDFDFLV